VSPRAPALAGAVLLVLAVASASWQVRWPQPATSAPAVSPRSAAAAAPAREASAPSAAPRSLADRLAPLTAASSELLRPGELEVCGVGRASAEAEADALQQRANAGSEAMLDSIRNRMRASADPHTRGAVLMAERDAAALVEMALRGSDPTLYAFALHVCMGADAAPAANHCRLLSAEQLARLDPDNLMAWLQVAQSAQQRGDAAGVAEAMHRASMAPELRHRALGFASLAFAALPEALTAREAVLAAVTIVGVQAALPLTAYQPLTRWCAPDALAADANRQQVCDRVARTMVDRASNLIDLAIGRRIGAAAGWPLEEVERYSARLEGYHRVGFERSENAPGGRAGCYALREGALWSEEASRRGEVATARDAVAQLGWTDASMLERHRATLARRAAAEAAASAAASAPR
jgi:hypothetical protein